MTVSNLPSIEEARRKVRKDLDQYYQDYKDRKPWTNTQMTREQYRLSLETKLEELDRELEAFYEVH